MDKKLAIVIVLDSVGVGYLPDAKEFGDVGADTLGHIIESTGMEFPNLAKLGLYRIPGTSFEFGRTESQDENQDYSQGENQDENQDYSQGENLDENQDKKQDENQGDIIGCYGKAAEITKAKDTTSGHWELMGYIMSEPFRTFPNGFPSEFIKEFEQAIGRGTLGNIAASGTEIIAQLGDEMVATQKPIVYTSADSVFQIAAHESAISIEEQYRICEIAREMLKGEMSVGRVIARPFSGESGSYFRTERRKDYSLPPESPTVLDALKESGFEVSGIGKIEDIFCHRGLTKTLHTTNNSDGIEATIKAIESQNSGLIFTNLVDFDMIYGHRNDIEGYARELKKFDDKLPEIIGAMREGDLLIITADHGCDPAFPGTDHTREYVPILAYAKGGNSDKCLGVRMSFADVGATVYDFLGLGVWNCGASMKEKLWR